MNAIYWLILFIVLLVIEIITLGLTTIWFAGGTLVALIASLAGINMGMQWILFFAVSIILLIFTRPVAMKLLNKERTKTNVDSLIGTKATVIETINNLGAKGKVTVNGMEWTARTEDNEVVIPSGEIVIIRKVSGVKLLVEKTEE